MSLASKIMVMCKPHKLEKIAFLPSKSGVLSKQEARHTAHMICEKALFDGGLPPQNYWFCRLTFTMACLFEGWPLKLNTRVRFPFSAPINLFCMQVMRAAQGNPVLEQVKGR
jgi:hypothetical protein